jgi:hypothetical protein
MEETIRELKRILREYQPLLEAVPEVEFYRKPRPGKWSKIEILGHLADSAQNNIRRFVVSRYEDLPRIVYNQDKWVEISHYQGYSGKDLVEFWSMLNKHICIILSNTSGDESMRACMTDGPEPKTIGWLAKDYIRHLLHHLHQVLDKEPVPYP